MNVRLAEEKDAVQCAEFVPRSIREICGPAYGGNEALIEKWCDDKTPENFKQWFANPDNFSIVVTNELDEAVAVAMLTHRGRIRLCHISPDVTYQGVGHMLVEHLHDCARHNQFRKITVDSTLNTVNFFHRKGYHLAGRLQPDDNQVRWVPMCKYLEPRDYRIITDRLLLRPIEINDAPIVSQLMGAREIAEGSADIPHPYTEQMARDWIGYHTSEMDDGGIIVLAAILKKTQQLVGAVSLSLNYQHFHAELGYWVGTPYWGSGYATEASAAMMDWGFNNAAVFRIHACHFSRNPASGRVLQKIGMQHEGRSRNHMIKWGSLEDVEPYSLLLSEWLANQ